MSSTPTSPIEGIAGTDASASKRGYYYQDVATALAWLRLLASQTLHIEKAEDYAVESDSFLAVNQVRNVKAPLTLSTALDFLEHVIELIERNPAHTLAFVYRTTSPMGERPEASLLTQGMTVLAYWGRVKQGADPDPLVEALRKAAAPSSKLAMFLDGVSTSEVVSRLVSAVTWAPREPTPASLQQELAINVATFAHDELDIPWTETDPLTPVVINAVTKTSTREKPEDRQVTRADLVRLLLEATHRKIPYAEYRRLQHDAALARNAATDPLDRDIEQRLLKLRKARFFLGQELAEHARQLARDVCQGGQFELGTPRLRSFALSWCARMLAETDESRCNELLLEAGRLSTHPHLELVEALLLAKRDKAAALRRIADKIDGVAQTIRYAIHRHEAQECGFDWIKHARLQPTNFDPDGMFLVLADYLNDRRWTDALAWSENIPDEACEEFPALFWAIGITLLAHGVAPPLRHLALEGPPVFTGLPLSNDPASLYARRRAAMLFLIFHEAAAKLNLGEKSDEALEFSLWLRLRDRVTEAAAAADILQRWMESGHESRWLPLALAANSPLDRAEEALRLDQRAMTYGSLNFLDARARLALILSSRESEWIDHWDQLKSWLQPYFSEAFLEYHELEALLQAGRTEAARAAAERAEHIPAQILERLRLQIDKSGDANQALAIFQSASTDSEHAPANLQILIAALVEAGDIAGASVHAKSLFELTKSDGDAEKWLSLLNKQQRWREIERFLDENPGQVEQSRKLPSLYLETLLRHGRWEDARKLANGRPELTDQRTLLELQIAVYSGHWDRLWEMLETALKRSASSLNDMRIFARLATDLGRIPVAKRYAQEIAEQCNDDPSILMECYMLAVRGHWEDHPTTALWVQKAVAQASEGGPIQAKSVEDLVAMAPEWRKRTDALLQDLTKGEIYLSLVAQQINRPLASLMLGTAEANRTEKDFRRRSPIMAFAGIGRPPLRPTPNVIALDQTALLTLGHLGLLPKLLDNFARLWVPHSVGGWLFAEHQDIQFHQPRRIYEAKTLLAAIAKGSLHIAPRHADSSRELAQRIGWDLAELIRAAQVDREANIEAYVIRPAPVHLVNSLGREDADVSAYSSILRSTRELVRSLHVHGAISEEKAAANEAFLAMHDQGWCDESNLPIGSSLYLDDLTVAYLHGLGIWNPLQHTFRIFIHPNVQLEATALSELEASTDAIDRVIEEIRKFLVDGQERDRVGFLRLPISVPEATELLPEKPRFLLLQALEQQEGVEAVVMDDRAGNRFASFTYVDGTMVAMRTSLDVLDWLRDKKAIDEKARLGLRNELRRAGYLLIPVEAGELEVAMRAAIIRDETLVETAAARAIRENHLLAQAAGIAQLPAEGPWLTNNLTQALAAITNLWRVTDELADTRVRADWLIEYGRWDGLASSMMPPWTEERLITLDGLAIARLLTNPDVSAVHRNAYNQWLVSEYLEPLQFEQPKVFDAICAQIAEQLKSIKASIAQGRPDLSDDEIRALTAHFCKVQLHGLPESIQDRLSNNDELLQQLGLCRSSRINIHIPGSPRFTTGTIYEQASRVFAGILDVSVQDLAGADWLLQLTDNNEAIVCRQPATSNAFTLQHAPLVAPESDTRIRYLQALADDHGLHPSQLAGWFDDVAAAPLDPLRLVGLESDLNDAPLPMASHIRELFGAPSASIADLVPLSPRYYDRLVLPYRHCTSLSQFAVMLLERGTDENPSRQARHELLWSSHSSLVPSALIAAMDAESVKGLCRELLPTIDLWSLTGMIEALVRRPDSPTQLFDCLRCLLSAFRTAMEDESGRLRLTVALGTLVDGRLNTCGRYTLAPVFWRRHASLAHAALIEREAVSKGLTPGDLATWASSEATRFQIATMADLTREPRWNGFLMTEVQLKQELLARVLTVLDAHREDFANTLDDIVFGEHSQSLASQRLLHLSALPGPLEGSVEGLQSLPEPLLDQLRTAFGDEDTSLTSRVLVFAHLAGMGGVPDDLNTQLAKSVMQLRQSDVPIAERGSWPSMLMRLALSAASSRHHELADAVLQLILDRRRDIELGLRVVAGLTACGAHADIAKWAKSVVEFFEQCAQWELKKPQATFLLYVLRILGQAQPLLRPAMGKLLARLQAVGQSIN